MKISILTATGNYNLWDELILQSELNLITNIFKSPKFVNSKSKKILDLDFSYLEKRNKLNNLKINIFWYDKKSLINTSILKQKQDSNKAVKKQKTSFIECNYIKYFPYDLKRNIYKNIKYLIKNIYEIATSDLIIIWWWWLLYDNEVQSSSSPLLQWYLRVLIAKLFKTKIIFLWIWINIKNTANYNILKKILNKSDKIYVRDIKSKDLLSKLNIKSKIIPDVVWHLDKKDILKIENTKNNNNLVKKSKNTRNIKYIWISLRQWYLKNEKDNLVKIVNLIKESWYEVIFLNTSFHKNDILANDMLFTQKHFPNEKYTKTQKETLSYFNKVEYVIWMRFHSIVLSIIFNKKCFVISYQDKTKLLAKNLDLTYINTYDFKFKEFKIKLKEFLKKNEINKNTLNKVKENKYILNDLRTKE